MFNMHIVLILETSVYCTLPLQNLKNYFLNLDLRFKGLN